MEPGPTRTNRRRTSYTFRAADIPASCRSAASAACPSCSRGRWSWRETSDHSTKTTSLTSPTFRRRESPAARQGLIAWTARTWHPCRDIFSRESTCRARCKCCHGSARFHSILGNRQSSQTRLERRKWVNKVVAQIMESFLKVFAKFSMKSAKLVGHLKPSVRTFIVELN